MANIGKAKQSKRNGVELEKTGTSTNAIESNHLSYRLSLMVVCLLAFIYAITAQDIKDIPEQHFQQNITQDTTATCRLTEKAFSKHDYVPVFVASSDSSAYFSELESFLNTNYNNLVQLDDLSYTGQVRIENCKIMFEGFGRLVDRYGGVYVGSFVASQQSGFGKMVLKDGTIHIGEWADNLPNGMGMFRSSDRKENYTGGFKNGLKHGKGHMEYRGKGKEYDYTGMMKDNQLHGWGYMKNIADGVEFEGHFVEKKLTGLGRTRHPDGRIVENCLDANIYNNPNMVVTVMSESGEQHSVFAHLMKCQKFKVIL